MTASFSKTWSPLCCFPQLWISICCAAINTSFTDCAIPQVTPETQFKGVHVPISIRTGTANMTFKFVKPSKGITQVYFTLFFSYSLSLSLSFAYVAVGQLLFFLFPLVACTCYLSRSLNSCLLFVIFETQSMLSEAICCIQWPNPSWTSICLLRCPSNASR